MTLHPFCPTCRCAPPTEAEQTPPVWAWLLGAIFAGELCPHCGCEPLDETCHTAECDLIETCKQCYTFMAGVAHPEREWWDGEWNSYSEAHARHVAVYHPANIRAGYTDALARAMEPAEAQAPA